MKIVLTQDVDKLGKLGETKNVAGGFAIHWLIPKGLAILEGSGSARKLGKRRVFLDKKTAEAQAIAASESKKPEVSRPTQRASEKKVKDEKKVKQLKQTKSS